MRYTWVLLVLFALILACAGCSGPDDPDDGELTDGDHGDDGISTPENGESPDEWTWTVRFHEDEYTPIYETIVSSPDTTVSDWPPVPERNHFEFDGWWTEPEGGGESFTQESELSGDLDVYAKWEPVLYTMSFDAKGGEPEPEDIELETFSQVERPEDPERPGYFFNDW